MTLNLKTRVDSLEAAEGTAPVSGERAVITIAIEVDGTVDHSVKFFAASEPVTIPAGARISLQAQGVTIVELDRRAEGNRENAEALFKVGNERLVADMERSEVVTVRRICCGVTSWGEDGGPRIEFVHSVEGGKFKIKAFFAGEAPLPDYSISRPIAANKKCRIWETGTFRGQNEKRSLVSSLFSGLLHWPEALQEAGYTLAPTPAIREVYDEAIAWHHDEQKFARDQAHANHFSRLRGTGLFDAGEWSEGTADERARAYRKQCGITGGR